MMENLAKAIIAVMKAVENIEKGMTVGTGGSSYKGVSDKDVKLKISREMVKAGLCILPIDVDAKTQIDRWEETQQFGTAPPVKKMKQSIFTEVTTKYLLLHTSGESQVLSGYGHGVDSQDKSAGKATTYALKNTLLYMFLVATGDIDDADKTHSDDIEVPQNTVPTVTRPVQVKPPTQYEIDAELVKIKAIPSAVGLNGYWSGLTPEFQALKAIVDALKTRRAELKSAA